MALWYQHCTRSSSAPYCSSQWEWNTGHSRHFSFTSPSSGSGEGLWQSGRHASCFGILAGVEKAKGSLGRHICICHMPFVLKPVVFLFVGLTDWHVMARTSERPLPAKSLWELESSRNQLAWIPHDFSLPFQGECVVLMFLLAFRLLSQFFCFVTLF